MGGGRGGAVANLPLWQRLLLCVDEVLERLVGYHLNAAWCNVCGKSRWFGDAF